jgi:hypothetical protein
MERKAAKGRKAAEKAAKAAEARAKAAEARAAKAADRLKWSAGQQSMAEKEESKPEPMAETRRKRTSRAKEVLHSYYVTLPTITTCLFLSYRIFWRTYKPTFCYCYFFPFKKCIARFSSSATKLPGNFKIMSL